MRKMPRSTAKAVMRLAVLQKGYTESPAGSNRTKFGKLIGADGQPWCAAFEYWCGAKASGDNPIGASASAAYIQEATVAKGGSWIMRKTGSWSAREAGQAKARLGDIVSFDFGRGNCYRQHTAFVIGRSGSNYICIEGNTSPTDRGSQSNGGCVAIRKRKYTDVCSIVRPKYGKQAKHKINTPYKGEIPTLPGRGLFKNKDKGSRVKALQNALNWASGAGVEVDGAFGNETLFGVIWFQTFYGLTPDGQFGPTSLKKLKSLISKHKASGTLEIIGKVEAPSDKSTAKKKKTKLERIVAECKRCAWKYGTPRSVMGYPNGRPKPRYKKVLNKAIPHRSGWRRQTRLGASCDVAVAAIMRFLKIDKKLPRGCDDILDYMKTDRAKKLWKSVKSLKRKDWPAGAMIYQKKKSGAQHISIYLGGNRLYNAHYGKRTYPVIQKASKILWSKRQCKVFKVWIPRG